MNRSKVLRSLLIVAENPASSPGFANDVKFKRTIGIFRNGEAWWRSGVSGLLRFLMNSRPVSFESPPNSLMAS